jgi:hypothetical protein
MSYHLVKTEVKPQLDGEMTSIQIFQKTILDDFGHDQDPIQYVIWNQNMNQIWYSQYLKGGSTLMENDTVLHLQGGSENGY